MDGRRRFFFFSSLFSGVAASVVTVVAVSSAIDTNCNAAAVSSSFLGVGVGDTSSLILRPVAMSLVVRPVGMIRGPVRSR